MLDDVFSGWDRGLVANDAHAAYERGEYREAAVLYGRSLESDRDNSELATRLASALLLSNRYEEAVEAGRRAMGLSPLAAAPAVYAAGGAMAMGAYELAIELADEGLRREPGAVAALLCKADILRTGGEETASAALLREARRLHPNDARVLVELASRVGDADDAEDVLGALREMAENPATPAAFRVIGLFSLGALLERLGDFSGAYRAFERANEGSGADRFDAVAHERVIDEIISGWTRERFERVPVSGVGDRRPVFLVGMPRTGSTLVEQILSCHPAVHAGGEMPHFGRRAGGLVRPPLGAAIEALSSEVICAEARSHIDVLSNLAPGAERVTDKLLTNFLHLGIVRTLFPNAAIVHCTRRPIDTALSCWQHNFRGALEWSNSFAGIAAFYRGHDRLMEHWRGTVGVESLHVAYEELVREPEVWSRRLVEHVGLGWDDACLKPHENRRAVLTSSREQVREPVHARAAGRADRYGVLLDPLRAALEAARVPAEG